jgi:hypothetical protein
LKPLPGVYLPPIAKATMHVRSPAASRSMELWMERRRRPTHQLQREQAGGISSRRLRTRVIVLAAGHELAAPGLFLIDALKARLLKPRACGFRRMERVGRRIEVGRAIAGCCLERCVCGKRSREAWRSGAHSSRRSIRRQADDRHTSGTEGGRQCRKCSSHVTVQEDGSRTAIVTSTDQRRTSLLLARSRAGTRRVGSFRARGFRRISEGGTTRL